MQNSTYNQLAALTLSDKFYCDQTGDQQMLHAAIGMQTEVGELFSALRQGKNQWYRFDRVNFLEEIGDMLWYLTIPQRLLDFDIETYSTRGNARLINKETFEDDMYWLNQNTTEVLDIIKKQTFYGRAYKPADMKDLLGAIYNNLENLVAMVGGNWDTVLKNNIDKLAARYEGAFSEFLANNRDLAKEYTILARSK